MSKFLYTTGLFLLHLPHLQIPEESSSHTLLEEKDILAGKKKECMMCARGILYPDEASCSLSISLFYLCNGSWSCQGGTQRQVCETADQAGEKERLARTNVSRNSKDLRIPGAGSLS